MYIIFLTLLFLASIILQYLILNIYLQSVPDGDWYCKVCKPPTKPKEKIKKRKKFEDELEEDVILTKETRHNRAKRVLESEEEGDSVDEELEEDSDDDMQVSF